MPSRLALSTLSVVRQSMPSVAPSTRRTITIRSSALSHLPRVQCLKSSPCLVSLRHNSSKSDNQPSTKESNTTEAKGPNQDVLPHVSEEAAAFEKLAYEKRTGKKCDGNAPGSPELEQGTPVDEVCYFSPTLISSFLFYQNLRIQILNYTVLFLADISP